MGVFKEAAIRYEEQMQSYLDEGEKRIDSIISELAIILETGASTSRQLQAIRLLRHRNEVIDLISRYNQEVYELQKHGRVR